MRAFGTVLTLAASAMIALSCKAKSYEVKGISGGFVLSATADTLPPSAQDDVVWRVTVRDQKTGQPIEGGQGSVWARNKDGHETSSGLTQAPELGSYTTVLSLVMAGQWVMGVLFRRDSLSPWASIDWVQEVKAPRKVGG